MLDPDDWNFLHSGVRHGCQRAPITGNDAVAGIDQNRDEEAECFDGFSNLLNLTLAVLACVLWIELKNCLMAR